jgi:hypothetical protein
MYIYIYTYINIYVHNHRWGLSNRKRGAGSEDGVPVLAKIQQADAVPCSLTYDQVIRINTFYCIVWIYVYR